MLCIRIAAITVAKSNASMREWNGRYRDDQRGACLVALARRGRRRRSRSQGQHRSRGLPMRIGGRNSKYKANIASQSITWQYVVPGVT